MAERLERAATKRLRIAEKTKRCNGAAISIHYRGGLSRGTNLLSEINGTQGDIQVTGASGHAQIVQLSIRDANGDAGELAPLTPPAAIALGRTDRRGDETIKSSLVMSLGSEIGASSYGQTYYLAR